MGPAERIRGPVLGGAPAVRLAATVAAVSAGVLLVGLIWVSRRDAVPPEDPSDVVRVGVVQGQSVPGYLDATRSELTALTDPSAPAAGETWALVSLDGYVGPGLLPDLLAGTAVAQAYARVPLPGTHTPVVRIPVYRLPADVMSGMLDTALARDREHAEYEQLARRLAGDDDNQQRARRAYATAARTAAQEASAYRSGCSCVFAAVVRAAPSALRDLADRPGVRAVDPAPEVRSLDRTQFRPPQPEENGTVPPEPSRSPAVPMGTPGIASRPPAPIVSSPGAPVTSASSSVAGRTSTPSTPAHEERSAVPSASDATPAHDATSRSAAP
ncbi:hypothetical protein Aab01nite_40800 [Paractinoplanes abujensis]|uniref:Uncharacterized protein n=1 Tax=Paractinoplanes abujensis TaxID=882441 RepID=A0A7W7G2X7_9ACTN|nr:hypothetical protein [Actinoplanes abujensis]MBB4694297.1 hypothetical protein [Actinoplanes abujensis]GID20490.1 hypothetical protein Aab01nite_40800 [Actinoplanes abujensis]